MSSFSIRYFFCAGFHRPGFSLRGGKLTLWKGSKIHGCSAKIWLSTLWCSGNPYGRISLIVKTWIDIRQVNAWGWLSFFEIIDMVWCRQAVENWIFWNVFTLLKVNRVASILAQVKVKEWMNKAEDKWERLKFS